MTEKPVECYLDTSILISWIKNAVILKKKTPETEFIEFLKRHPEIKTFISSMTTAEIASVISREFPEQKLSLKMIREGIVEGQLQALLGYEIIKSYISEDEKTKEERMEIRLDVETLILLSFLGKDVKDAMHIEIARQSDKWFVYDKDADIGRMQEIYPKIITVKKLMKQYE